VQAALSPALRQLWRAPFARSNTSIPARKYDDIGAGLTPAPLPTERVITTGLNFDINQHVVVKRPTCQWFRQVSANNRFNLGLGWSF